MASRLQVHTIEGFDDHAVPTGHPERPARLDAALAGIAEAGLMDATSWHIAEPVDLDLAKAVHEPKYLESLEQFCLAGAGALDPDTFAAPGSWTTARRAAGAVVEAIESLRADECDVAFAAARPPGHHAVRDRAMGFCLINNAAVGAASITARGERVAVLDWDVHHGNGTQDIFYDDPNVLYVSTHESPLYPGTGLLRETGGEAAPRTNLNLPMPPGTRGDTYRAAFDEVIAPVIEGFAPDWLIISAGFDGHRADPLASLELTAADYADLARRVQQLVPARRIVVVLEGGYDLEALTYSTGATLAALLGEEYRPELASSGEVGRPTVTAARQLWELD